MSVFSFCATLIKNYKITVPDGSPLPDMKPNAGLTNRPKPFEIKLVKRCWFWFGICRWFFSGERLKDFIQWRLLLILTIQRWFETYFPPRNPNGPVFWLILRYLTYEGQHLYLFILCMYMLKNWLPMLIFIAFRCQCLLFINCTLLYYIYILKFTVIFVQLVLIFSKINYVLTANLFLKRKSHYLFAIFAMIYITLYIWYNGMSVF